MSGKKQKKFAYNTSEIRLIESMEDICNVMLEYNMHKEREGMSENIFGILIFFSKFFRKFTLCEGKITDHADVGGAQGAWRSSRSRNSG